ncbi:uncharacterized protein METZ01_LOCUS289130 [marine metagenome]|uniref:Uncharacterized protein n=1 Tax=marine metagenome TaxID=408172 RepID=A0A382LI75_9ZZZZ
MTSDQKAIIIWLGPQLDSMGLQSLLQSFVNHQNSTF